MEGTSKKQEEKLETSTAVYISLHRRCIFLEALKAAFLKCLGLDGRIQNQDCPPTSSDQENHGGKTGELDDLPAQDQEVPTSSTATADPPADDPPATSDNPLITSLSVPVTPPVSRGGPGQIN